MSTPDERPKVSRESIAAEVRAQLARRRRSARSVALELGWTQRYMARRVNGEVPFNVEDLAAIAELLDVPVISFFQGPVYGAQLRKQPLAVAA
jgi:transcriptional regulator with XRE-family HTH domain